ncbi:MAG: radical SAM protein [Patescibacteria group bacterium]
MISIPSQFVGWLTINRSCNLRCDWCYAKESGFAAKDMTLKVAKDAIEIYKGLRTKNVMLIGGEPTIHPHFLEIVQLIHQAGLNPLLVTNGVRFSDLAFAKATVAAGIHRVIVSLKGSDDSQYQLLTGRSAFTLVQEGIRNLASNGLKCTVSITICADTLSNFDEILEAAAKSGAKQIAVNMERPVIIGKRTYANDMVAPRRMAKSVINIYPKLKNCGMRATIKLGLPFCLFTEEFIETMLQQNYLISGCQLLRGSGIIFDPQGRLIPCHHFCSSLLGKLGDDFTTGADYLSFRRKGDVARFYNEASSCPNRACIKCKYWRICGGGCRIHWLHWGADELIGNFQTKERR